MNNRTLRSFALGILFSSSIIGSMYYFSDQSSAAKEELTDKELVDAVKDLGYTVTKEETATDKEQQPAEESSEEKKEEAAPETQTPSPEAAPTTPEQPAVIEYNLQIISGMNTSEIATILKDANIVDDAFNFEQYLINSGYHTNVQIGNFVVRNNMTYEEIAKIITKS